MKYIIKFTFVLAVLILRTEYAGCQDGKTPLPWRFLVPLANKTENYGIEDAVISYGAYDNYKISNGPGFAETHIAVNPRNPLNFVATDNRVTGFNGSPFLFNTTDGGVLWNSIPITISAGDPVFCADSLGNFYYTALYSPANPTGVSWMKSIDGGTTWVNLGNVFVSTAADKQWVTADQTAGPYSNYLYMIVADFQSPVTIKFFRSTNQGVLWSTAITLDGPGYFQTGSVAVGPEGRVYASWAANNGGGPARVKYSNDGGATFSNTVIAANYSPVGVFHSSGRYVLKGDIRVNGFPHLACDLSTGPYRGTAYLCYASNPGSGDNADVFMTKSTDGGNTWSSAVRVNNDATTRDQWMHDVSVDNQGRVWVMWWDSRNDPGNLLTETYAGVSTNGGQTFTNIKVSIQQFNPAAVKISQSSHYYLGDYQAISGKTFMFPCWTGQENTLNDYVSYLPDYGISFNKTSDTVIQGQTSTVRVRVPVVGPYAGPVNFSATVTPVPLSGTISFVWLPGSTLNLNGNNDSLTLNSAVSSTVPAQSYTINVTGTQSGGPRTHTRSFTLLVNPLVGITGNNNEIPPAFHLYENYPNPFNPATKLRFSLPRPSEGGEIEVRLLIYDILGREVASLVNDRLKPGKYEVTFDGTNYPSGVYFYKLLAGEFTETRKMMLLR